MPNFIVKTHESVAGTYHVTSKGIVYAERLFHHIEQGHLQVLHAAMNEGMIEQIDYQAFSLEVQEIREIK